eukprot:jgi/Chlat1/8449/Chrsp80S07925
MGCQPSKNMHEMASAPQATASQPHHLLPVADNSVKKDPTSAVVATDSTASNTIITTSVAMSTFSDPDKAASNGEQPQQVALSQVNDDINTDGTEERGEPLSRADVADPDAYVTPEPSTSAPHFSTEVHALTHIGFGPLKRENQDTFYVKENFLSREGQGLFCVFDGHGSKGRAVATFAQEQLPAILSSLLDPSQSSIDTSVSGSTVSVVLLTDDGEVVVGSAGDSRVLLATRRPRKSVSALGASRTSEDDDEARDNYDDGVPLLRLAAEPLSQDHRPGRPDERERVEAAGGRVQAKRTEHGVTVGEPRIWLKDIDMPGLLVSRALGDDIAASVGCSAEPELTSRRIDARWDRYLIIASDGIWDVLNNQRVVNLCIDKSAQDACEAILQEALLEWEDRHLADNITIILVKFNPVVEVASLS